MIGGTIECPKCNSETFQRIPRTFWMKVIPFSRLHLCSVCQCKFFTIAISLSARLPNS